MGSGRIFPLAEERILIDRRDFPAHFARIGGIDFGFTHPTAAVEVVWDRDQDIVYVTKTHRLAEASPIIHAAALRPWAQDAPRARPIPRRLCLGRGGLNGYVAANGKRQAESLSPPERLARGMA